MAGYQVIDDFIQTSSLDKEYSLKWISSEEFVNIESSQNVADQTIYYAQTSFAADMMLLLLGNNKECTPAFMGEFASKYSLPRQSVNTSLPQFRRYAEWLKTRNSLIYGFTKHDDNYYMVAGRSFHHYYSRYGFCSAC